MGVVDETVYEVRDRKYAVTAWPASEALDRLAECVTLAGEDSLLVLVDAFAGGGLTGTTLAGVMSSVARNAASVNGGLAGFARRMFSRTVLLETLNGTDVRTSCASEFDRVFSADLLAVAFVLAKVAERNFAKP